MLSNKYIKNKTIKIWGATGYTLYAGKWNYRNWKEKGSLPSTNNGELTRVIAKLTGLPRALPVKQNIPLKKKEGKRGRRLSFFFFNLRSLYI
jgi:hypothetical protein